MSDLTNDGEPRYYGHRTMRDGTHIPLTKDEAEAIHAAIVKSQAERRVKLPDEQTALNAMFEAFDRLRELGWREAIYCPKDGSTFEVIEAGSTGIHQCHYEGEWPNGSWWVHDEGDQWPSRPILYRLPRERSEAGLPHPPKDQG